LGKLTHVGAAYFAASFVGGEIAMDDVERLGVVQLVLVVGECVLLDHLIQLVVLGDQVLLVLVVDRPERFGLRVGHLQSGCHQRFLVGAQRLAHGVHGFLSSLIGAS